MTSALSVVRLSLIITEGAGRGGEGGAGRGEGGAGGGRDGGAGEGEEEVLTEGVEKMDLVNESM